jgi:hypothetical protein
MLRKFGIIAVLSLLVTALVAVPALAQSGHFVTGGGNAPTVTGPDANGDLDISGKVAGLGGTTFEVIATADAQATYACRTGGGEFPNAANKQDVGGVVTATTGPQPTPRNGQATFDLTLNPPTSTLTCPPGQTRVLVSVSYTNLTLTLEEDGVTSDTETIDGEFSEVFFPDFP